MKRVTGLTLVAAAALMVVAGCNKQTTSAVRSNAGGGDTPSGSQSAQQASLSLTTPKDVSIKQTKTENVTITIKREKLTDPVMIKLEGLPKGVKVADDSKLKIPADKTETEITLSADAAAAVVSDAEITVTATAGDLKASQKFKLNVKTP